MPLDANNNYKFVIAAHGESFQWHRVKNELTICKDKKKTISFTFQVLWRGGRHLRCGDKVTGRQSTQIKKLIIYNRKQIQHRTGASLSLSTIADWRKLIYNLFQGNSPKKTEWKSKRRENKIMSKLSLIRIKEGRSKISLFIYHTASFLAFCGTHLRTCFCRRNKLETAER